jgi:hypothetical protein
VRYEIIYECDICRHRRSALDTGPGPVICSCGGTYEKKTIQLPDATPYQGESMIKALDTTTNRTNQRQNRALDTFEDEYVEDGT